MNNRGEGEWDEWDNYLAQGPPSYNKQLNRHHEEKSAGDAWEEMSTILFEKSEEELLGMAYIPI